MRSVWAGAVGPEPDTALVHELDLPVVDLTAVLLGAGPELAQGLAVDGPADPQAAFEVEAVDASGTVVGRGTVERVVVDRGKFLARLPEPA